MSHANDIASLADEAVEGLKDDLVRIVERLRAYLKDQLAGAKVDADGKLVDDRVNTELAAKLEADIGRVLVELGYDAAIERVLTRFEEIEAANEAHLDNQFGASFSTVTREALAAFVNGVVDELTAHLKTEAAATLKKAMLAGVTTHLPLDQELEDLAHAAEITLRQAVTEVDTSIMAFHREALTTTAEEAGFDLFRYDGPDDGITRPFCAAHVGRVYTAGDLDDEDNGQGLSPTSRFLGGYNCRHSLSPVTVEEARDLATKDDSVIGGPDARRIVLGDETGSNEAAFVAAHRGEVVKRGGKQTVVRRRRRAA